MITILSTSPCARPFGLSCLELPLAALLPCFILCGCPVLCDGCSYAALPTSLIPPRRKLPSLYRLQAQPNRQPFDDYPRAVTMLIPFPFPAPPLQQQPGLLGQWSSESPARRRASSPQPGKDHSDRPHESALHSGRSRYEVVPSRVALPQKRSIKFWS